MRSAYHRQIGNIDRLNRIRGVATIPIVLVFGILIIAVGVGIATLSYVESITTQSSYQSARALVYAEAGVRDALVRIARDKNYACADTDCYSIALVANGCVLNQGCVSVSVSGASGTSTDPKIIVSKGQAGVNVRRLRVLVFLDESVHGRIEDTQWAELTD